ncbi:hypothetical protein JOF29_001360 [Kribbella aluminosa]|uniref:Uncharacterized protein n=1 Tax=Kribbella aluminosa TaxID=416017 RepID=A0ABS4UF55_9ACTN|nr:hypothetical protein [Kribbella aluminosa]
MATQQASPREDLDDIGQLIETAIAALTHIIEQENGR